MQEVRGSTPGKGFFLLFRVVLFCFVSFFNFFLPIDWFQFIHSNAPLQLHEILR